MKDQQRKICCAINLFKKLCKNSLTKMGWVLNNVNKNN